MDAQKIRTASASSHSLISRPRWPTAVGQVPRVGFWHRLSSGLTFEPIASGYCFVDTSDAYRSALSSRAMAMAIAVSRPLRVTATLSSPREAPIR
jgi:hypothetical protein